MNQNNNSSLEIIQKVLILYKRKSDTSDEIIYSICFIYQEELEDTKRFIRISSGIIVIMEYINDQLEKQLIDFIKSFINGNPHIFLLKGNITEEIFINNITNFINSNNNHQCQTQSNIETNQQYIPQQNYQQQIMYYSNQYCQQ